MQIFVHFLIVSSILGYHKGFHKFILGGVVLMDYVSFLKHLAMDYELGYGIFLFGKFKSVCGFLGLFLLFGICFKFLFGSIRFFCELRAKSRNLSCSKNVLHGKFGLLKLSKAGCSVPYIDQTEVKKKIENLSFPSDSDGEIDSDGEFVYDGYDDEFDTARLKELVKMERQKVKAIRAEVAKERAAAASAAEEAMSMILRLQQEKSLVEMEWMQYKRLVEEKQNHDEEVIKALQWLVWQKELEKLGEDESSETCSTSFNGNILEALENVLYSSRDT